MDLTVLAVGNSQKGDDGIGLYAGRLLAKRGFEVIFCGVAPENFLGKIRTRKVLLVDAADIDEDYAIGKEPADIPVLSTHGMSLSLLQRYLKGKGIDLIVAGIKPEDIEIGERLSETAKRRAENLVEKVISKAGDF